MPNVVGKSLAAAKKAIKRAHCAVGKIRHAQLVDDRRRHASSSESPKARTHVDYKAKVALVVSTG